MVATPDLTDVGERPGILAGSPLAVQGVIRDYIQHLGMFSRNARLFTAGTFLISLAFTLFHLMRNLYLKEAGFGEVFIGHSLSVFSLGSLAGSIPAAILLSKRRTRPILIWSTVGAGFGYFGIASLLSEWGIFGASLGAGIMMSVYQVAAAPFLMNNSSPAERTHLFSSIFAVRTAAGVVGSLGGGWLFAVIAASTGDAVIAYRWTLWAGVGMALLAVIPFVLIREERPVVRDNPFALRFLVARRGLYTRIVVPFFVLGLGAGLVIPFLNLYFRNRFHQDGDAIGVYFGMMQLCMTLGIMAGPVFARRWGLVRTIVYTELLSIPFMIMLAYTYALEWAVLAFLLRGMLMNMAQPLATNFSMEVVTPAEHPLVNSLVQMSWMGSWMISTAFGGTLIEAFGFTLPLLVTVGLYISSALLYMIFFGAVERAEHVQLPIPLTDLKG